MRGNTERQTSRPRRKSEDYPFNEAENQIHLTAWRERQCQVAYNHLFTNLAKIVDSVVGYLINRGILSQGSHCDYKQDALCRLVECLPTYSLEKGKLYSFAYGTALTHVKFTVWNDERKHSRIDLVDNDRTMEVLLGHTVFVPHIGLDLQHFLRVAVQRIRCQHYPFDKRRNALIKIAMFRSLMNRGIQHIPLTTLEQQICLVRYRLIITELLDEHFPDGVERYHELFRNFFK